MLRIGAAKPYHAPLAHGINDIQELSMTHEAVSRAKTQVLHRIQTHYRGMYAPRPDFVPGGPRLPVIGWVIAVGRGKCSNRCWRLPLAVILGPP